MRLPGGQHPPHAGTVSRVPHDRVPVGVEQQYPAAGAQDAPHFGERAGDVLDVLEDLRRDDRVEGHVRVREPVRVPRLQLQRGASGRRGPGPGDRQHALARVDAAHPAASADLSGHLGGQEARSDADVQHPLAGPQRQRPAHHATLLDHILSRVDGLDAAGYVFVKVDHGGHDFLLPEAVTAIIAAAPLNDL